MDKLSPERRSANMSRIRSKDSVPEMVVRRLAFSLGFRFRLHRADLPGKPDLVFPGLKKVIFVHGCFWHQHQACREGRPPRSNPGYWHTKLGRNVLRDAESRAKLEASGWECLVIWECQTADAATLQRTLQDFLASERAIGSNRRERRAVPSEI